MAAWGALWVCTTTQTSGLPVEIHTLLKAKRSGTDKHEVLKHIKNTTTREQFSILEAQTARGWKGVLKKKITLVLLCFPSGMCCWSSRLGWMVWPSWACCYLAGQTHHRHPKLATHLPFQPIKGKGKEKEYSGGTEGRMHRQPLERAGREAQFGMKHRGHGACWVHNRVRECILSEGVRMVARRTEESWADPDVLQDEKVSCRQLMK